MIVINTVLTVILAISFKNLSIFFNLLYSVQSYGNIYYYFFMISYLHFIATVQLLIFTQNVHVYIYKYIFIYLYTHKKPILLI